MGFYNGEKYMTIEEINYEDSGMAAQSDELSCLLSEVLVKIPGEIVQKVYKECFFFCPSLGEKGSYFPSSWIDGRSVIVFSRDILEADDNERTILHEVAHHILGHQPFSGEWKSEEKAANDLAKRWLSEFDAYWRE